MSRILGHGRYARETYPQATSVFSPNFLTQPWTDVAAGATFQPTNDQPWLAVDTSGDVQVTIEMPENPYDGQPQLVADVNGNAAVNPVIFTAADGVTIDNPQDPGTYAALVTFTGGGGTVWWKYRASTSTWIFFQAP